MRSGSATGLTVQAVCCSFAGSFIHRFTNPVKTQYFASKIILAKFVCMERFMSTIRNKYLIATVAFAVWMLFFDRHDMATQYGYYRRLNGLKIRKKKEKD